MSNPISGLEELFTESALGIDAGPHVDLGTRKVFMSEGEGKEVPFTSLTSKQTMWEIHGVRGNEDDASASARTSWDGNPDQLFNFRNRNHALNDASQGAIRTGMIQCQNRSGGRIFWMRALDIEIDNRGTVGDTEKGLRIGVRNNSIVTGDVVGIELELLGQAAAGADDIGIDLIHNDASSVTYPVGINVRASRVTNGFAFLIRTEQYGIDLAGAASANSALMKLYDDGENADLATGLGSQNGAIKVVIGTTVGYIPTYASYT